MSTQTLEQILCTCAHKHLDMDTAYVSTGDHKGCIKFAVVYILHIYVCKL